ncbi:MAG: NTP transferase domain-containing protein [Flavobacteriales bacterium]|jgi:mannose-1-phosphate guanylyltransferase|nr:NTP transferase domain-containing protein [Flavobacteriales bacterium]MBK6549819.1 NTP transferase domain-containing protein [Flavobacteriales bacterium]MBK6883491.1 NTP transferase domain-containing protein [Flavobacteriales bacterium]MBK7113076.1 NTP transferase domain-containing protein [Flavobacteriales bacterium]MBK7482927.1 NTP transferase domain-containing protein [Flavobacteriales bacterium]
MSNRHTYCVIMAGGVGSRFWPMSRSSYPKQFLDFLGLGRTLLQQTYDRFLTICPKENILVVTNANYASIVHEQLPDLAASQILSEPARRNTAPCIAYANQVIQKRDPEAVIIVAPSDHLVMKQAAFEETIQQAIGQACSADCLVTLGIMPHRPDTGYGYIQFEEGSTTHHPRVKRVKAFTEKPDHETAMRFIESGDFVWNAGIFIWSLASIRKAFKTHLPEMEARFEAGSDAWGTLEETAHVAAVYDASENVSIDYGIMEKAKNVFTVLSDFGWSDLGTWGSLYEHLPKDPAGNATIGKAVKLYDCERNVVHAHDERLMVLQGLEDFIVVSTKEALLVCRKQDEQQIKRFVLDLTAESGDRYV